MNRLKKERKKEKSCKASSLPLPVYNGNKHQTALSSEGDDGPALVSLFETQKLGRARKDTAAIPWAAADLQLRSAPPHRGRN